MPEPTSRASQGGLARAAKLTAEERRQIGIAGSLARWGKTLPEARYGSRDRPLRLGADEIGCYVLEDGRRLLEQGGFISALGLTLGGIGRAAGRRLSSVVSGVVEVGISAEIAAALEGPILFRTADSTAYGYEANLLSDVCGAVLSARPTNRRRVRHALVRERCETLAQWVDRGALAGLVDDAVGLESEQVRERLAGPLSTLVQDELRAWVGGFPPEFFEELHRLCGLDYSPGRREMPVYLGRLTDDVVYERLGPGTREELNRLAASAPGSRTASSTGAGAAEPASTPRLREHMASVVALMKISGGYEEFAKHLDTALPRRRPRLADARQNQNAEVPARITGTE